MAVLFVGVDVSKGYADVEAINEAGSTLVGGGRFDDTHEGHSAVREWLAQKVSRAPEASFQVGIESSGGLERNWLAAFRALNPGIPIKVHHLNPLSVKRFLERDLHRNVTDRISALGIARYLRLGMKTTEPPFSGLPEGAVQLFRCARNAISRSAEVQNELQSLLPRVFPELVQFCRSGFPQWILHLLIEHPTPGHVMRSSVERLKKIRFIPARRVPEIFESAKSSVASQTDPDTAISVTFLAEEILNAQTRIDMLKAKLITEFAEDPGVKAMSSIPGIGAWTATSLRIEIGNIERFPSPEALTAFAGLDPRIRQSGDREKHIGISRKGRRQIRALLFPPVLVGLQRNPIIGNYYAGLRSRGKGHLVSATACMRKLLHIIYGCWIRGAEFDPTYEARRQAKREVAITAGQLPTPAAENPPSVQKRGSLKAPISRLEARKRKTALTPQTKIDRRERGLEAVLAQPTMTTKEMQSCGKGKQKIP